MNNKKAILFLATFSMLAMFFSLKKTKDSQQQEKISNLDFKIVKIKDRYASVIIESTFKKKKLNCSLSVNSFNNLLAKGLVLEKLSISGNIIYWTDESEVHINIFKINELSTSESISCKY